MLHKILNYVCLLWRSTEIVGLLATALNCYLCICVHTFAETHLYSVSVCVLACALPF